MQAGLIMSVLLHVSLLAWAMWAVISTSKHDLPDTPPIDIAIITPSELTRLRQGDPDSQKMTAKAEEKPADEISKKEAKKPKPITAPEPPAAAPPPPEPEVAKAEPPKPEPPKPEPEKMVEPAKPDPIADKIAALPPEPAPKPGPTPEELKKLEEQKAAEEAAKKAAEDAARKAEEKKKEDERRMAEAKKKAEEKKKAEVQKKKLAEARRKADEAKKKKLEFDPDRISALLDKTPDKRGAPSNTNAPDPDATQKGPTAGTRDGKDSVLSVREQDLLLGLVRSRLKQCWRLPGGGGGASIPMVTLRWRLNPDGTLNGVPQVEGSGSGPMYQVAVDTAMRAVHECAPFTLPPDKYDAWKELIWDFDPTRML